MQTSKEEITVGIAIQTVASAAAAQFVRLGELGREAQIAQLSKASKEAVKAKEERYRRAYSGAGEVVKEVAQQVSDQLKWNQGIHMPVEELMALGKREFYRQAEWAASKLSTQYARQIVAEVYPSYESPVFIRMARYGSYPWLGVRGNA